MWLKCPKCGAQICKVVENTTVVNVQVHCPFDGMDFGMRVEAAQVEIPAPVEAPPPPAV